MPNRRSPDRIEAVIMVITAVIQIAVLVFLGFVMVWMYQDWQAFDARNPLPSALHDCQ